MFYIKQEIAHKNIRYQISYDDAGNILSTTEEEIINTGIEIYYYRVVKDAENNLHRDLILEQDFEHKTLFDTEEEANVELEFIVQDEKFEKSANITYSIVSE